MNIYIIVLGLTIPMYEVDINDLDRFPSKPAIAAALKWSDDHIKWLETEQLLDRVYPEFWTAWIAEARKAREPWIMLNTAIPAYRTDYVVNWYMDRLTEFKARIGDEAYFNGHMPSIVPLKYLKYFKDFK